MTLLTTKNMTSQQSIRHATSGLERVRERLRAWEAAVDGFAPLAARLFLAPVMFAHGAQKAFGWWGGYGFEGTMGFFKQTIGLPSPMAFGIIVLELLGPVFLLLGLFTRPIAAGLVAVMIGAIASVHGQFGFYMNWSGAQAGEGFEFHLLVIGLALSLLFSGSGRLALDRRLARE
jgi:putative oxidoreductase